MGVGADIHLSVALTLDISCIALIHSKTLVSKKDGGIFSSVEFIDWWISFSWKYKDRIH